MGRSGTRTLTIPVDATGPDLDETERVLRAGGARAAYLIPDFHNPTGALLDDSDRERLARALRRSGTIPLIDETVAEVDLDGGPAVRPFGVLAPDAIALGSAAKTFWGGLRIG